MKGVAAATILLLLLVIFVAVYVASNYVPSSSDNGAVTGGVFSPFNGSDIRCSQTNQVTWQCKSRNQPLNCLRRNDYEWICSTRQLPITTTTRTTTSTRTTSVTIGTTSTTTTFPTTSTTSTSTSSTTTTSPIQGNVLFSDDFESYTSANSPPNVRSGTIGWYHGDDGPNAGNAQTQTPAHNGADIDQSGSDKYPDLTPPTGYHRVYTGIPTHSGSKAVKYLSDVKTGCKLSMMIHNVVPTGSGSIQLTDFWVMIPTDALSVPTTRNPIIGLVMMGSIQVAAYWDSSSSDSWRFQFQTPDKSFTNIGSYTLTKAVWHHFQIVYDHATQTLLDIVVDGTHPFLGLPSSNVRPLPNDVWDSGIWWQNTRNVAAGETECVEDTGFQVQMYVDDFSISQLQSWP
ncbi:MAG: hypothetical protein J4452_00665 [Candidatus Aenigmarchaeota archaeon]|nr:hypothetical protein [Candidatus Aenigmarchaeota archaeon]